jgi:hypothetical protein
MKNFKDAVPRADGAIPSTIVGDREIENQTILSVICNIQRITIIDPLYSRMHLYQAVRRNLCARWSNFFLDIHNILCFKAAHLQYNGRYESIRRNLWVSFFTTLPRAQKARFCQI